MRALVAHPGTQHSHALVRELDNRGQLGEFWTGIAFAGAGATGRCVRRLRNIPLLAQLRGRVVAGLDPGRLRCLPVGEIRFLLRLRAGREPVITTHERNADFQRRIPSAALRRCDAVVAFDTSAWLLATRARSINRPLILDRSIAHPADLHRMEQALRTRYPEWVHAAGDRPDYLVHAEEVEHQLAHRIVVGSTYARRTLISSGVEAEKVVVNCYGVDWQSCHRQPSAVVKCDRACRFVFVGSITGRKGIPVLLEAWSALGRRRKNAELWLVGPCGVREQALLPRLPGLKRLGRVPHDAIAGILGQTDVLVLPSLCEGFGLVLLEALAAGLPILATENTGAPDLLRSDVLGRALPAGSVEALVTEIERYISTPPNRRDVAEAAAALSDEFSWRAYGSRWSDLLNKL